MRVLIGCVCLVFCLTSCVNNKQEEPGGVHPDIIYHDYKLTADEDRGEVTMLLQYRLNGPDGDPFLLDAPSKVSLDGMELKPDSAKLAGTFYEFSRPIEAFKGSHTIVFTDSRSKEHEAEFSFEPFQLAEEIPEALPKKPFVIELDNVSPGGTKVRLVMIDTAFQTADVNEELEIKNGRIQITPDYLVNLATGPITLEIYTEEEKPLKGISRQGGRVAITYGIRRQFEFVD